MYDIHLIERNAQFRRVEGTTDEWITGNWKAGRDGVKAEKIVGGNVYLHLYQKGICYFGGQILKTKYVGPDRIEIRFRFDNSVIGMIATGSWGQEQCLVKREGKATG